MLDCIGLLYAVALFTSLADKAHGLSSPLAASQLQQAGYICFVTGECTSCTKEEMVSCIIICIATI
jgi:hypothetical protein